MQYLLEWRIILDVLLISLLIYSIYRALRATGAWKIALGLTLAAGVALVARLLDLYGIEWIFSNFTQIALVAVLIIFQPEIRRVLERSFSFHRARRRGGAGEVLPKLVDQALFDLAEKHWGALIVFAGEVPLKQWVTEGVKLDAALSVPLLLSIFDPDSPGHDGAAVIEGNRLNRFGVHLPLSETNRLSNDYGTRHHAAMGLSERTDALVFAVSEERGVVTAFRDGKIYGMKARGEVAQLIHDFVEHEEPGGKRKTKKDFFYAVGEVVASLSLAVLIWITFIQPKTEIREMIYTVPIEYERATNNMTFSGKKTEAKLLLQGPLSVLRNLDPSQLRVRLDLSSLPPGRHRLKLADAEIIYPDNLKLVEVEPYSFDLEIRKVDFRNVPIKPQLIGTLPRGYVLTSVEILPGSIAIEETADIAQLTTTPIYLSGLREDVTMLSKLIVPEKLQSRDREWPDVTVRLSISEGKKK